MGSAAALPCLLLCILYLTDGASAKPRYMVVFPSVLYYPYTGKVHVHLMDLDAPVRVTLHMASSHGVPNVTLEEQGSDILQLNWPHFNISTRPAETYEVAHVHISIQGGSLQVSEQKKVLVKVLELATLVQTDKDIYESGETVKFRIVRLDQNLIPSNRKLPLVAVQGPSKENVAEWREVSPRQGIVDLSFQLAAEPALGTYVIRVEGKSHSFVVNYYVPPHFDVLIRLPHFVTMKDEKIPLEVCGRYPSGKTFRGRAEARLCQSHKRAIFLKGITDICAEFRGQTGRNGCFSTEVPMASFNLTSSHYESRLDASASLLEEGGEMWRVAAKSCMIVHEMVTVTFENANQFYKPGIPYTGTMLLKGMNSSTLKEKEVLLMVNTQEKMQIKTLLMDGLGRASFELDTSGWNDEVFLYGELKDDLPALGHAGKKYIKYQSVARYLYPLPSDSKSFLKIHKVEKKLPCGQPQQLRVDYLFDEKPMGIKLQSLDVVFLVLAKGTIVSILKKELRAEAGLRGSFSLELPIGPELAPMAKVLGYVVLPGGETVADSTELKVAKCFPSKVNLFFSEQRALVGSQVRLKVQAAPGSLCAVYAVDQRSWSSGPEGKLNPSMVYNLLPTFSEDSYYFGVEEPDLPDCGINRRNQIAGLPAINCFDVPEKSWKDCYRMLQLRSSHIQKRSYSPVKVAALKTITNAQLGCAASIQFEGYTSSSDPQGGLEEDEQMGVTQDTGMQMDCLGTWLWELVPVGEGGSAEMTVTVPDVITEWEAGMFCTSPQGLGLAPATTLTAFKPFVMELALPYVVVHHEAFTLVATIFNYLQQCLQVQVTLAESAELEVSAGSDEAYRGCVCVDEEKTFQWSMRATSLGKVNVTVIAKTLHSEKLCGTEIPMVPTQGYMDTKTKLLIVQPPRLM